MEPPAGIGRTTHDITEYGLHLLREGYAETTIVRRVNILRQIAKSSNLLLPDAVKDSLSHFDWCNSTREIACDAYRQFASLNGLSFVQPRYRRQDTLPFIPTEAELDVFISDTRPRTSAVLQMLKETGARIGEALSTNWSDIDAYLFVKSNLRKQTVLNLLDAVRRKESHSFVHEVALAVGKSELLITHRMTWRLIILRLARVAAFLSPLLSNMAIFFR